MVLFWSRDERTKKKKSSTKPTFNCTIYQGRQNLRLNLAKISFGLTRNCQKVSFNIIIVYICIRIRQNKSVMPIRAGCVQQCVNETIFIRRTRPQGAHLLCVKTVVVVEMVRGKYKITTQSVIININIKLR